MPSSSLDSFQSVTGVAVSNAAGGQFAVVAADPTRQIKVVSFCLVATGAVTVQFQSANNALSGAMALAANGGIVAAAGAEGSWLLATQVNQALNITTGGAVQLSGYINYYYI